MEEIRQRFDEIVKYAKGKYWGECPSCPCEEGCNKIPEEDTTPCETILFIYVETGETENFEKYLTNH